MSNVMYRRWRLLACTAGVTISACHDSTSPVVARPETPPPTKAAPLLAGLIPLDGSGQVAAPGAVLPRRLSVEAMSTSGTPLSGVAVVFTVTEGGGAITPDTAYTNVDGFATSGPWTLGTSGRQTAKAQAGGATANFTATAFAPDPSPLTSSDTTGPPTGNISGRLAFVRADTLFVHDIGASSTTTLRTLPLHSHRVNTTALSPDRSLLAFVSSSSTDICMVLVSGGEAGCDGLRYHDLTRLAWSPDGRRLAFIGPVDVQHLDGPFPYPPDMRDAFVEDMSAFGLIGAGPPVYAGLDFVTDLAWSPDGQKLAVAVPGQRIYTINADGSGRELVYARNDVSAITGIRWSPDGRMLALTLELSPCTSACDVGIAVVRLDGSGSRLLARAHASAEKYLLASSWSPDGSALAYSAVDCSRGPADCRQDVFVVGASGGRSRLLLSNAESLGWWP